MSVDAGGTSWNSESELTTESMDSAAQSGDGGGILQVHTAGKFERLTFYGGARENLSTFNSPAGVTGQYWDQKPSKGEEIRMGLSASGLFLSSDGSLLSGQASLVAGDPEQTETVTWAGQELTISGVVAQEDTDGAVSLSGAPPAGVFAGDNGDLDRQSTEVVFAPYLPAVTAREELSGYKYEFGTVEYGKTYGQIVDYNGEPVEGVGVNAGGLGTNSADDGLFELLGPIGQTVTLVTLNGTLEGELTFRENAEPEDAQQYAFSALTIEVLDAEYSPVKNAPVTINGETYLTAEDGTVTLTPVGLGEFEAVVMDKFEATLSIDEQGVEQVYQVGPDTAGADWEPDPNTSLGGVKITAIDDQTGRQIRRVSATVDGQGVVDTSDESGVVKLLTTEVGQTDVTALLATGDKRYNPTSIEIPEIPDGEMATAKVRLRRKDQVVNT